MKNVAVVGQMCAGKTTLANLLVDIFGYEKVSMAANIKNIVNEVYGPYSKSSNVFVTTREGQVVEKSIRTVLQQVGESVKDADRDFWLKWFLRDSEFMDNPLVMDDVRLGFEGAALAERGWLLVRLECPLDVRLKRHLDLYGYYPTETELLHPTETEQDLIQAHLYIDSENTSPTDIAHLVYAEAVS
jgi:hypothetical protein